MWPRIRDFILSPIRLGTIVLFTVSVLGAAFLWLREFSYAYPGPAIALAIFALVILAIGLVVNELQTQRTAGRPPRLIGLELLVERWQTFDPKQKDRAILHEQFSIALSIAELAYSHIENIRFIRYFAGFKIKGGAFLVQPGQDSLLVLKFDSSSNIEKEKYCYEHCVARRLGQTPGEPWVPPQRRGTIAGEEWGAIVYSFVGSGQSDHSRLQTLAEYYLMHNTPQRITSALNEVFEALRPWWMDPKWSKNCELGRRNTLYGEYHRLTGKLHEITRGITKAGRLLGIESMQNVTADREYIKLYNDLRLRNPLNWVCNIFAEERLPDWIDNQGSYRRDSIVHGDLHAGNVLISEDDRGQIGAWVIDFPHTHVGPTIQDIARLEADLKFGLLEDDTLQALGPNCLYDLETNLLPESKHDAPTFRVLIPAQLQADLEPNSQVQRTYVAIRLLRDEALKFMIGNDARPYYLALLHATMPALYYRNRGPWQKLYTFISAALLCERLGG